MTDIDALVELLQGPHVGIDLNRKAAATIIAQQAENRTMSKEMFRLQNLVIEFTERAEKAEAKVLELEEEMDDWLLLQNRAVEAEAEVAGLHDTLKFHGFEKCSNPVCNCGSWHPRFGLIERWREITDDLADAGYPLTNENGHIARKALSNLIADLAKLKRHAEAMAKTAEFARIPYMKEVVQVYRAEFPVEEKK